MENLRRFETVHDYNIFNNNDTLHPLVSIVDLSKAEPRTASNMYFGFYTIFLKEVKCGDLKYGRATYDYQEGTLVFIGPSQVVRIFKSQLKSNLINRFLIVKNQFFSIINHFRLNKVLCGFT